jgi:hypothetical protein
MLQCLSDLWLYSLHNQVRLMDHNRTFADFYINIIKGLVTADILLIKQYFSTFFKLMEKALLQIQDDNIFLYIFFNMLKKVNIFMRVIAHKGNYIMNFECKVNWV